MQIIGKKYGNYKFKNMVLRLGQEKIHAYIVIRNRKILTVKFDTAILAVWE